MPLTLTPIPRDTPTVTPAPAPPFGGARVLSTKRAFAELCISKSKGFSLIKAGVLETVKVGRTRLVKTDSLLHVMQHGVKVEDFTKKLKGKKAPAKKE